MNHFMMWLHKKTSQWYAKNVLAPKWEREINHLEQVLEQVKRLEEELDEPEYEVVFEPDFDRTVH